MTAKRVHKAGLCEPDTCRYCERDRRIYDLPPLSKGAPKNVTVPVVAANPKGTTPTSSYGPVTQSWSGGTCGIGPHKGKELMFSYKGREIYGFGNMRPSDKDWPADVAAVIDLNNNLSGTRFAEEKVVKNFISSITGSDVDMVQNLLTKLTPHALREYIKKPEYSGLVIRLDWPDGDAPEGISLKFWKELWANLPTGKILVGCMGGHGRTGTAICALLLAITDGAFHANEYIETVRRIHCDKSVETKKQVWYLEDLCVETGKWAIQTEGKESKLVAVEGYVPPTKVPKGFEFGPPHPDKKATTISNTYGNASGAAQSDWLPQGKQCSIGPCKDFKNHSRDEHVAAVHENEETAKEWAKNKAKAAGAVPKVTTVTTQQSQPSSSEVSWQPSSLDDGAEPHSPTVEEIVEAMSNGGEYFEEAGVILYPTGAPGSWLSHPTEYSKSLKKSDTSVDEQMLAIWGAM